MADGHLNPQRTLQLSIASTEAGLYSGEVNYVIVSGTLGELGIYPGHLQLLTSLKPGYVRFEKASGEQEVIYVSGGVFEVQPHMATILADTATRAEDIDEVAAEEAKHRAEEILSRKGHRDKTAYEHALHQTIEAGAKLQAIKELQKHKGKK
ncbi:MAG: F0F1 ATP synthase subunit epsilon [Gammaproteobacteria bacterium]|nr:F0F1 ATP synthase subunit epsilon [Gammaproteobacteria bacterium]